MGHCTACVRAGVFKTEFGERIMEGLTKDEPDLFSEADVHALCTALNTERWHKIALLRAAIRLGSRSIDGPESEFRFMEAIRNTLQNEPPQSRRAEPSRRSVRNGTKRPASTVISETTSVNSTFSRMI